jgi:hypothetical protein
MNISIKFRQVKLILTIPVKTVDLFRQNDPKAVSINKGCNCILTEVHSLLDEEWRGFPAAKVRQRVAAS